MRLWNDIESALPEIRRKRGGLVQKVFHLLRVDLSLRCARPGQAGWRAHEVVEEELPRRTGQYATPNGSDGTDVQYHIWKKSMV